MRGFHRFHRGVSLLETIVSLFIATLSIATLSATFSTGGRAVTVSRHREEAANACSAELDARRRQGYTPLSSRIASGASTATTTFATTLPNDLPNPQATLTLQRIDSTFASTPTDTGRVRMDAQLSWGGIGNDRGTVTLTALVRR